jgi:hypothetical protein
MTADLCEAELPILIALHLLGKCNVTVSEVHCLNFIRIVRDPGFYARPKRFPRPGVKHVRKMISGVTEVLDQP